MSLRNLVVYSRPGCHLCEDMILALDEVQKSLGFEFEVVNIDSDSQLESRYGLDIPVLCGPEHRFICQHRLSMESLHRYLASC